MWAAALVLLLAVTVGSAERGLDYAARPDGLLRLRVRSAGSPDLTPAARRAARLHVVQRVSRQATSAPSCECIDYYLCVNGTIDTSGGFALDSRLGEPSCIPPLVCCRPPAQSEPLVEEQPQPQELGQGCGLQRPDASALDGLYSRIQDVDDREAYYGEFPWMLAVLDAGQFVCGASLVHPQVALTAAHCVSSSGAESLVVRAGEWDPMSEAEPELHQDVAVARVLLHPRFRSHGLHHDAALLFLERPLQESRAVGLVCMASNPDEYDASKCLASGWGTDQQGSKPEPFKTTLRRVELPIVEQLECQDKLRLTRLNKYFVLHDSFICSGGQKGKDTCKGDGGGPLVCALKGSQPPRYVQVGVVSWGVGCGEPDTPAVYVDVAKHAGWISDELRQLGLQLDDFGGNTTFA